MNQTIKTGVGLAIIIIFGITVGAFTWYVMNNNNDAAFFGTGPVTTLPKDKIAEPKQPAKMCTQEAKACPDGSFVSRTEPNCEFVSCPGIDDKQTKKTGSELTPIDSQWNLYTNHNLGFSIKVPKKSGNQLNNSMSEVAVIEEGNLVFITAKGEPSYSDNVKKIKSNVSEYDKASGIHWAILVKDAKNDGDLEKFIQNRYGKKCEPGAKNVTSTKNLYNVGVLSGGPEDECFLNYAFEIKYDPVRGKVVAWDTGQSRSLFITNISDNTEDIMSKSFQFID